MKHRLEAFAARLGFALLAALPLDAASAFAGWLTRRVGPLLKAHRIAERNMRRALPALDDAAVARALDGMWDNLGRVVGELTHLPELTPERDPARIEIVGAEHVAALRDDGQPGLLVTAHFGNWELPQFVLRHLGLRILAVYRAANNPLVDAMIQERRIAGGHDYAPKGNRAARELLRTLRDGGHAALLVDQKLNNGIAVPFFGREAMTPSALAELALRFDCPVLAIRVERLAGARFRFIAEPPFRLVATGDKTADVQAGMRRIHGIFERWIAARPDQWFWVHRRWPD